MIDLYFHKYIYIKLYNFLKNVFINIWKVKIEVKVIKSILLIVEIFLLK